ncbi:DUF2164 domain-containing protein [Geothrix sp. PMB-07]|uniref:DUF2164 domain-containing protein n=1 Tax=Geothrix sp. PMB-07 TaxID=3068640 RepID=UPI0027420025|nr:DUF2164 domain-containing protein [Geothrix sp. PMB-07]WLT30808.1 DUF2164 domain-containing protein [Geothrix sp. PMB-07]
MDIKLSPDTVKRLQGPIQRFVSEEYGENLGQLGADTFLTFCLKEIGPAIYNQAIADAQSCMQERVTDLENICFAEETSYWGGTKKGMQRKPDLRR